jgi:hypothetical protein
MFERYKLRKDIEKINAQVDDMCNDLIDSLEYSLLYYDSIEKREMDKIFRNVLSKLNLKENDKMNKLEIGKKYMDYFSGFGGNIYEVLDVKTEYKIKWQNDGNEDWVPFSKCKNDVLYKEPVIKELTVQEISDKLGYEVKIIK